MASAVLCQSSKAVCVAKASKPARVARSSKVVSAKLTKANANVDVASAVVSTAVAASSFHIWQPNNNKMFETFSYLPPLTDREIAKQVDYIVRNSWVPCLEFSDASIAYTDSASCLRMGPVSAGYYDNRYWTMWKLPMFGCKDASQVLREVEGCVKAFPNAYVRLVAFDNSRQVQIAGFLVHRPSSAKDWSGPEKRSVKSY